MKKEIGSIVVVANGGSEWMKSRNYWLDIMGDTIDGLSGVIVADYTDLPGDDSHFGVDLGFGIDIGVNPKWLLVVENETT